MQEGINLAILEPTSLADLTELVGHGIVDFGMKCMLRTVGARAKGFPITSIGTLLDEPPAGLIALKTTGINSFQDIVGKRVGYMGEFNKKMIDNLAVLAGIDPTSYQTIRTGMNTIDAICRDVIDIGFGHINFQRVELEYLRGETIFLRLDQLAGLGCCCFCSIQFVVHERMLSNPDLIQRFLNATQRGAAFTTEQPEEAYKLLCQAKPMLRTPMYEKIFMHTLPFFSRTLQNVERDWDKVCRYAKHLKVAHKTLDARDCYTNEFLPKVPYSDLQPIACCLQD